MNRSPLLAIAVASLLLTGASNPDHAMKTGQRGFTVSISPAPAAGLPQEVRQAGVERAGGRAGSVPIVPFSLYQPLPAPPPRDGIAAAGQEP